MFALREPLPPLPRARLCPHARQVSVHLVPALPQEVGAILSPIYGPGNWAMDKPSEPLENQDGPSAVRGDISSCCCSCPGVITACGDPAWFPVPS